MLNSPRFSRMAMLTSSYRLDAFLKCAGRNEHGLVGVPLDKICAIETVSAGRRHYWRVGSAVECYVAVATGEMRDSRRLTLEAILGEPPKIGIRQHGLGPAIVYRRSSCPLRHIKPTEEHPQGQSGHRLGLVLTAERDRLTMLNADGKRSAETALIISIIHH